MSKLNTKKHLSPGSCERPRHGSRNDVMTQKLSFNTRHCSVGVSNSVGCCCLHQSIETQSPPSLRLRQDCAKMSPVPNKTKTQVVLSGLYQCQSLQQYEMCRQVVILKDCTHWTVKCPIWMSPNCTKILRPCWTCVCVWLKMCDWQLPPGCGLSNS